MILHAPMICANNSSRELLKENGFTAWRCHPKKFLGQFKKLLACLDSSRNCYGMLKCKSDCTDTMVEKCYQTTHKGNRSEPQKKTQNMKSSAGSTENHCKML